MEADTTENLFRWLARGFFQLHTRIITYETIPGWIVGVGNTYLFLSAAANS